MSSTKSSSFRALTESREHIVTPEQAGVRLDRLVADLPGLPSRSTALRLIRQGLVWRNDVAAEADDRVQAGDRITYSLPPPEPYQVPAQQGTLNILYEDAWLLVIDKPAGMPMHPGPGHRTGTLVNYLLGHCSDLSGIAGVTRPGIVHRLDKDTSGVVVVAKNDEAHLGLAAQFKARTTHRTYLALVVGSPRRAQGTVDLPLARERDNRIRRAVRSEGKRAVTHWRVVRRLGPFTLLQLKLETGRTHQIRVHMAHEGWPLLGDPLYGRSRHRGLALAPEVREQLDTFRRQALHAAELGFSHPHTGEWLQFSSPLPADFRSLLDFLTERCGKDGAPGD